MKRKQLTKRSVVIALGFILAACVPAGKVRMVQNTSKDFQLQQRQGVVVARVINASPYSQTFNYMTLSPKNVYEKKENQFERIPAIKTLAGKTTIFASPLPAGDYSLADLFSFHAFYAYYYRLFASADPKFGTFKIEPGKITNLGTIIYYQKPDGDKYYQILARKDEFKDALEYLQNEKPELYNQIDPATMLSWNEDDYAAERHNLYLNVAQNPVTFDNAYPQEDGSWQFTSKLGILLQRTAQGKWVIDALDTDYDLVLFNRNAAGDMAVVDETGAIYFKGAKSGKWTSITKPDTKDNPGHVQLGDTGDIYLISSSEKEIKVRSGKVASNPEWREILTYNPANGWQSTERQLEQETAQANKKKKVKRLKAATKQVRNFSAVLVQGKTLVATNETLYELDLKHARATKVPVDLDPTEMDRNAYNQLSISRYSVWDGSVIRQYSLDAGATWHSFSERFDSCPESKMATSCGKGKRRYRSRDHIATPVFFADGQGYSIIREVHTEGGFFTPLERTTTYMLVVSTDRGTTWVKSSGDELPKYCGGLRKGPDENTLLLSCEKATGQFYKADRSTLKWEIDYQPALF